MKNNKKEPLLGFTRREQAVVLVMCILILIGIGIRVYRHYNRPEPEISKEEFFQGLEPAPPVEKEQPVPAEPKPVTPADKEAPEPAEPKVTAPAKKARAGATRAPAQKKKVSSPVNINRATVKELESLPRIGPALAQRIIAYRKQQGAFKKAADIQNVKGIGEKTFQKLAPLITVE